MRVSLILATKGREVTTIPPTTSIFDASRALRSHGIGALVVSRTGEEIEGIISERDIARSLADHGERALVMLVQDLMTREVMTCTSTDTVERLMSMMTEHRIRHVPVVEEGRLMGIISIGDVVKHRLGELEQEAQTLHDYLESGR